MRGQAERRLRHSRMNQKKEPDPMQCRLSLQFNTNVKCTYRFYNQTYQSSTNVTYEYKDLYEILQKGSILNKLKPTEKLSHVEISINKDQNNKIHTLIILDIINNVENAKLIIQFELFADLNLSDMKPLRILTIVNDHDQMPKEYLHHLVELLRDGKVQTLQLINPIKDQLSIELDEFNDIEHIETFDSHYWKNEFYLYIIYLKGTKRDMETREITNHQ